MTEDSFEIRQRAGNLSGQFEVKGLVNANGALTTMTLDCGDVQIIVKDPKNLPFLQRGDQVFVAINVVQTAVTKNNPLPLIPNLKN